MYNLSITGLRFFTVYRWGRPDIALMIFANAIFKGEPIKVFNNGDMQRDFTYINDIVEGVVRCITTLPIKQPKAKVFNIGNSKPVDLMEFIIIMETCLGKKATKNFLPMQEGDVKMTYADTTHLKQSIKYNPLTPLKKGIIEFTNWFYNYTKIINDTEI
ncbi:NAD-dependent epimerase/dehydratase family protein [Lutibacter sp. B1]|uniref:NAD-dependent epimerase/dehydratase family protein n=1 Tax=Lutibacter sp. B1 TaxID=2725996 RepID=UPI0035300970